MSMKSIAVPVARKRASAAVAVSTVPQASGDVADRGESRRAARVPAGTHRYRVGQQLKVVGSGRNWGRVGGLCKVVALMPHEAGPFLYRVRTDTENFERVVAEADLATLHADTRDDEGAR